MTDAGVTLIVMGVAIVTFISNRKGYPFKSRRMSAARDAPM